MIKPKNSGGINQEYLNSTLEKILKSPIFSKAHRHQTILRYLLKETIAGNSERLKGYTIGVEFFDRGVDFDPNLDAIVRVEIGRLRVKLREYYKLYGQADTLILDLPKGSYAVTITLRDIADGDSKLINRNAKLYPTLLIKKKLHWQYCHSIVLILNPILRIHMRTLH